MKYVLICLAALLSMNVYAHPSQYKLFCEVFDYYPQESFETLQVAEMEVLIDHHKKKSEGFIGARVVKGSRMEEIEFDVAMVRAGIVFFDWMNIPNKYFFKVDYNGEEILKTQEFFLDKPGRFSKSVYVRYDNNGSEVSLFCRVGLVNN